MYVSSDFVRELDELVRKNLEDSRNAYFWWVLFSTGIVAIGIVLEGPEVVHEAFRVFRRRLLGPTPDRQRHTPSLITLLALLGWIFVAMGVAGEGVSEAFVSMADGTLQTFNNILLMDTQRQTAEANANAESARAMAKGFDVQISDSNARAKYAEAQVASAKEQSAKAERDAAQARLELAKIQERMSNRLLTDQQASTIEGKVEAFPGQEFKIVTYWELKEPLAIANRIYSILLRAAWKFIKAGPGVALFSAQAGVVVYVHPAASERARKAADSLVTALLKEGIDSELRHIPASEKPDDIIQLNVGTKP